MIKIEKISATKATVIRGGLRQPLILHSHITAEELASVGAEAGTIVYSVDETEVKELVFQPKLAVSDTVAIQAVMSTTKPVIKQPAPRAAKVTKPEQ